MQEKRKFPRKPIEFEVTFILQGATERFTGRSRDLSVGGMFIVTDMTMIFGQKVELSFELPKKSFAIPAVVRWTAPDGFGVQFGLIGAKETHAILEALKAK